MATYKYIVDFVANNDKFKRDIDGISGKLKTVATAAAAYFSVDAIVSFTKTAVAAYNTSIQAETALLTALKGRSDMQGRLIDQASELMDKTLYDDDEIVRAQSLVAAFVKEEAQIKKLIPLIQDFATAKQMDLAGAADLVTKTLAGEMNALGRYGIKVEGAAGSAERFEMIQKGLNNAFGGQAEAAAKVGTAALVQLENQYGNLLEVIGKLTISQQNQEGSFTKILTNATKGVTNFLNKVATWSDAGFGFSQSIVAAFASSDEDTKKLAESLVVVKEQTQDAEKETKTYSNSIDGLNEKLRAYNEELLKIAPGEQAAIMAKLQQINAIEQQLSKIEKLKASMKTMAEDTASGARADKFATIPQGRTTGKLKVTGPQDAKDWTKKLGDMNDMLDRNQERVRQWSDELTDRAYMIADAWQAGFANLGMSIVDGLGLAEDGLQGFVKKLAETAMQLISIMLSQSIANSIAGATASGTATGPAAVFTTPAFIATAIGGVMAAFAAIPSFNFGGIVPGSSFTGDRMLIRANSGEEVLTRSDPRHSLNSGGYVSAGGGITLMPSVEYTMDGFRIHLKRAENNVRKRT